MLALTLLPLRLRIRSIPAGSDQLISFAFAVWSGVFSLFMISTFWARIAHLHSREEAKRVYGVIAAGSEGGQLLGSAIAALVYSFAEQRILLVSILLMEAGVHLLDALAMAGCAATNQSEGIIVLVIRTRHCARSTMTLLHAAPSIVFMTPSLCTAASIQHAPFAPAPLHTILRQHTGGSVWYERAELANAFASSKDRFAFFSTPQFLGSYDYSPCAIIMLLESPKAPRHNTDTARREPWPSL